MTSYQILQRPVDGRNPIDWEAVLTRVFQEAGHKPKRAGRSAAELLNVLYGAQVVARLLNDPQHLRRTFKRLARSLDNAAG
jgi:hypothetical protein